jgi:NAD+ synthetase
VTLVTRVAQTAPSDHVSVMSSHALTLALVQLRPVKGDYDANLARIGALLADCAALDPRPDVVQFPETATTGYFVEGGVRELAVTAGTLARDVDAAYRDACRARGAAAPALDVVIGFYEVWRSTLYNAAAYLTVGGTAEPPSVVAGLPDSGRARIRHLHRKHFLPTYGLFDEERFVERGLDLRAFDAPWGRGAILVCEDAWHSLTGTIAALDGAQVVFVSSAAPARGAWPRGDDVPGPASVARWERLVRDIAEEHGVFVAYANLVGSEGGKTLGGSSTMVGPKGDVRARAPVFDEAIVSITVDLGDLARARADSPLLNDLRVAMPHLLRMVDEVQRSAPVGLAYDAATPRGATHGLVRADESAGGADSGRGTPDVGSPGAAQSPTVPDADDAAGGTSAEAGAAEAAARGAPPEAQHGAATPPTPDRFTAPTIPITRIALADHGLPPSLEVDPAMLERWLVGFLRDELTRRGFRKVVVGCSGGVDSAVTCFLAARAIGPEHVIAVRMPYRTSSPESLAHAQLVIDALGLDARTVDISPAVDGYLALEPEADPARRGNVMARLRMIVLFDLSAKHRAIPLGTGNKTERLFGYFTWHADDSPPVNPLGDLYKTQVWALARHLGVPSVIVDKPASADLVAGQTDEGDFGISYARADQILNALLFGYRPEELVARGVDAADVERVRRRVEGTHWKRRLPAVAMVSPTAIGEAYLRPVDY